MNALRRILIAPGMCVPALAFLLIAFAHSQVSVTTYHYDNFRTGWNSAESTLTPANVGSSTFGLLRTVKLDDQVDAQPLLIPGVNITAGAHKGKHDVVYVVTGNDTVYAIDANDGTVLLQKSLGKPVFAPQGCNNNGPNVGITSTPVIDTVSGIMYVMAYTQESQGTAYHLHALDLGSLSDKVTTQLVVGSHALTDGTTFNFNASVQRQRPALLLANGTVYAGFGSFCDNAGNLSRGWLLGWTAGTLAPLPANQLLDTQATDRDTFFLSSIWMSGYGLATDDSGNILFVTGNSDGHTYDGVSNIQESVVKVSSDLTTVLDLFTPKNQIALDAADNDFGAGGVLVLPDQPGSTPHLAVAAGKTGAMFLMNEDHLGGFSTLKNNVLGTYQIGACWCGESYFIDPKDGIARVVSSGNSNVEIWKVHTSPTPSLTHLATSPAVINGQNGGFFTSVSSNGKANPIIWALGRPASPTDTTVFLYAFDPDSSGSPIKQLFQGAAGSWPNFSGDSNQVPVVANGKVYVGANQSLEIFGLKH
jgi:hypothetical protein